MSEMTKTEQRDEINRYKKMADILKIEYSENIGLATLKQRVDAANKNIMDMAAKYEISDTMTDSQKQQIEIKRAKEVTRIQISSNNPAKAEYQSVRFEAGNRNGSFARVVPLSTPWYCEAILINVIKEAKYRQPTKDNGSRIVPAYSVIELPHLTPDEVIQLRKLQDLRAEAA